MDSTDEALKRLATFAAAEGVPWVDTTENLAALQADIRHLLTLVKTPAESERLAALAAWEEARWFIDGERNRLQALGREPTSDELIALGDRVLSGGVAEGAAFAALTALLDTQRKGATDGNG